MPDTKKTKKQQSTESVSDVEIKTSSIKSSSSKKEIPDRPRYAKNVSELVDQASIEENRRPVNVKVSARQGESAEQMLRRFNFAVNELDIIQIQRDKQFYEKPSKAKQREMKARKPYRTTDK